MDGAVRASSHLKDGVERAEFGVHKAFDRFHKLEGELKSRLATVKRKVGLAVLGLITAGFALVVWVFAIYQSLLLVMPPYAAALTLGLGLTILSYLLFKALSAVQPQPVEETKS